MRVSVDELALRFRVLRGATRAAAELPALARLMQARLAGELGAALGTIPDADGEVVVVREAVACVDLRLGDRALDQATLRRVSEATREAVVALLDRPADDEQLRRFPSESAYAGTFVVELLDGTAWDRWWLERFRRFRRGDVRDTLVALLADAETETGPLFAWLEQRGRLAAVLTLVGPTAARRLALSDTDVGVAASSPPELFPLAAAAFAIAESLGFPVAPARQAALLAEYRRMRADMPSWRDRDALTAWIWELARWVMRREPPAIDLPATLPNRIDALGGLLAGSLDWLDGEWIAARARAESFDRTESRALPPRDGAGPPLAPRHAALLRRLAALVARGSVRASPAEPRDQLLLRLVAALDADTPKAPARPDGALVAALDDVIAAFVAPGAQDDRLPSREPPPAAGDTPRRDAPAERSPTNPVIAAARAHGPAAIELLRAMTTIAGTRPGLASPYAGIYLLVRSIADLRLERLAERAGIPFASLLAAIVAKLLGAAPPWDDATLIWLGGAAADPAALDPAALRVLQPLVLRMLTGLRHLAAPEAAVHHFAWREESFVALSDVGGVCWPLAARAGGMTEAELLAEWRDASADDVERVHAERAPTIDLVGLSAAELLAPEVEVLVTSIATCVLRAMSHWLPGLSGSSAPFVVRTCLRRTGSVAATGDEIAVTLERGPLDAVLDMASAFAPVPETTWLGRRVRFTVVPGPP